MNLFFSRQLRLGIIPFLLLAVFFASCGDDDETASDDRKVNVVTTLPLFADFVREVGGDRVEVTSLLPPGADPHTWEPSPGDARRVAEADLAFANGLGLDAAALEVIEANAKGGVQVVELAGDVQSVGLPFVEGGPQLGPFDLIDGNPHLWLGRDGGLAYAAVVYSGLETVDPGGATEYRGRFADYMDDLLFAERYTESQISRHIPGAHRKLITTHDAFAYFGRDFGMEVIAVVSEAPGQDPTPEEVANLARAIESEGVPAVFLEPQISTESKILRQAAEDAGVEVCTLYSDSLDDRVTSYVELMRFNADELVRCLGEP